MPKKRKESGHDERDKPEWMIAEGWVEIKRAAEAMARQ